VYFASSFINFLLGALHIIFKVIDLHDLYQQDIDNHFSPLGLAIIFLCYGILRKKILPSIIALMLIL
jgi:DMSO/TMAO reductase YedYZ heme-binding membrane subunit